MATCFGEKFGDTKKYTNYIQGTLKIDIYYWSWSDKNVLLKALILKHWNINLEDDLANEDVGYRQSLKRQIVWQF